MHRNDAFFKISILPVSKGQCKMMDCDFKVSQLQRLKNTTCKRLVTAPADEMADETNIFRKARLLRQNRSSIFRSLCRIAILDDNKRRMAATVENSLFHDEERSCIECIRRTSVAAQPQAFNQGSVTSITINTMVDYCSYDRSSEPETPKERLDSKVSFKDSAMAESTPANKAFLGNRLRTLHEVFNEANYAENHLSCSDTRNPRSRPVLGSGRDIESTKPIQAS